jgi:hypothetical protein
MGAGDFSKMSIKITVIRTFNKYNQILFVSQIFHNSNDDIFLFR